MANRGRHRKRHVKCILHVSRYHISWISKVLDDDTITKILDYQSDHSGNRALTIFESDPYAGTSRGGFNWANTLEGPNYWNEIMDKIKRYKLTHNV